MFSSSKQRRKFLYILLSVSAIFLLHHAFSSDGSQHLKPTRKSGSYFRPRPPLPEHTYTNDGLLVVNPEGNHPIYELIARAEKDWNEKLARASRTLSQAVREYKARYGRPPPKGFDDWWYWAESNNVLLPDEYDQIYHDLQPFWGIEPNHLRDLERNWEGKHDTATIGKRTASSPMKLLNYSTETPGRKEMYTQRAIEMIELLEEVAWMLPAFRMILSPHDNPDLIRDWELVDAALDAASQGKHLDKDYYPSPKPDSWLPACSLDSPANSPSFNISSPASPRPKSFIYDHKTAMDPCLSPHNFVLHGNFLGYYPFPRNFLVPQFSFSTTRVHTDIVTANNYGYVDDLDPNDNPLWEDRTEERVFWKGSNTGMFGTTANRWREAQRPRLVEWASKRRGNVSVLSSTLGPDAPVGSPNSLPLSVLNEGMDISFSGEIGGCSERQCPKFIEDIRRVSEGKVKAWSDKQVSLKDAGKYKYVFDVDGHGWSGRFKRLITSYAVVFKMTVYPEWFQDRIQPWLHYVPIQMDLSDMHDAYTFFRGEPALDAQGNPLVDEEGKTVWKGGHDELAKKIGKQGREWSLQFWREEDLISYMIRLLLEYGRVMSPDRETMNYVESDEL